MQFEYRTCAIISRGFYTFLVYNVERLILQTIYVLNKEILQFFGLKSAVYNWERFQIKRAYGTQFVILYIWDSTLNGPCFYTNSKLYVCLLCK